MTKTSGPKSKAGKKVNTTLKRGTKDAMSVTTSVIKPDSNLKSTTKRIRTSIRLASLISDGQAYCQQYRGPGMFNFETGELFCLKGVPRAKGFRRPDKVSNLHFSTNY